MPEPVQTNPLTGRGGPSPGCGSLQCSVLLTQKGEPKPWDWFLVEIRGSASLLEGAGATLGLWIEDLTCGSSHVRPVLERLSGSSGMPSDHAFLYKAPLTRVQAVDGSTWQVTVQVDTSMICFARCGLCALAFSTEVIDGRGHALQARSPFTYENRSRGYLDLGEDLDRARTMALALALGVATRDEGSLGRELGYVRGWALAAMDLGALSLKSKRRFEKALQGLAGLFSRQVEVDLREVCDGINQKTPVALRYDILEFCIVVAGACGQVGEGKLALLKDLVQWLELDPERFRAMMAKAVPMQAFQVIDAAVLLGIQPDMPKEDALRQLNREYAKWNARVTNPDDQVRSQADQMINLIARTRHQYAL
ncbi:MAG: hypothetical protein KBE04_14025 [Phycisphaerae bacterium]|nr:hypothetical protein [Phycisphaerae bacterium]